jgi:1-acyl-sn-glycerol-3-phosphate acyltransferase
MRLVLQLLYGLYAATLFLAVALATLLTLLIVPRVERRRRITRGAALAFLRLAGMRLTVSGLENLPRGQCVVVANHSSYLDGLVLTAALPPRFAFVIKREMARVPLAGRMLRRIGSEFVERYDRQRTAADARRVLRHAVDGNSLVFFPEGTFSRKPGLLKFHAGAFLTAARAGCPIVPAVVRGTRSALPPGSLRPAPASIDVMLLPALPCAGADRHDASGTLRDQARLAILAYLDEPDLEPA